MKWFKSRWSVELTEAQRELAEVTEQNERRAARDEELRDHFKRNRFAERIFLAINQTKRGPA